MCAHAYTHILDESKENNHADVKKERAAGWEKKKSKANWRWR